MKRTIVLILFLVYTILILGQTGSQSQQVTFVNKESEKKVDVFIDGKLITSYCWLENVYKPILYPVFTSAGTEITRGFPLKPRAGERDDHIHQVGIWLNYGNVNGFDFWGNGSTGKRSPNGGEVKHLKIDEMKNGAGEGILVTSSSWLDPSGKKLLAEKTEYHFLAKGPVYIIDRITTLTTTNGIVSMKDTKEGMFGIRVARQLELPSKEALILLDKDGKPGKEKMVTNEGVTGNYRSSEGVTGEDVWSTRAGWMDLYGTIGDEKISLVVCDHPKNQSYPTYWHARGYGLFAANPLGANDFTKGKEVINFSIPSGQSVTFRYRVIISSGVHLTDNEINALAGEFSSKY
ncbi:MAG: PmoA family protein [Bacteroidales bacterium]|nr:PmoA family protein [Bacteroidales bacterium]